MRQLCRQTYGFHLLLTLAHVSRLLWVSTLAGHGESLSSPHFPPHPNREHFILLMPTSEIPSWIKWIPLCTGLAEAMSGWLECRWSSDAVSISRGWAAEPISTGHGQNNGNQTDKGIFQIFMTVQTLEDQRVSPPSLWCSMKTLLPVSLEMIICARDKGRRYGTTRQEKVLCCSLFTVVRAIGSNQIMSWTW